MVRCARVETDALPRGRFNYALVRNAHRITGAVDPRESMYAATRVLAGGGAWSERIAKARRETEAAKVEPMNRSSHVAEIDLDHRGDSLETKRKASVELEVRYPSLKSAMGALAHVVETKRVSGEP